MWFDKMCLSIGFLYVFDFHLVISCVKNAITYDLIHWGYDKQNGNNIITRILSESIVCSIVSMRNNNRTLLFSDHRPAHQEQPQQQKK